MIIVSTRRHSSCVQFVVRSMSPPDKILNARNKLHLFTRLKIIVNIIECIHLNNMEILWDKLDLNRPPTTSWITLSGTFDVPLFDKCIHKIYNDLQSQELLHKEAMILSRLIYRLKTKFRHDKGLMNMEKINRALRNYFYLSLEKEYKNLKDNIVIDSEMNTVTLPTRQMLQYVLIRTQGFAKLMRRIQEVAFCAGKFFRARVTIGQAWTFSMIAWSTIARIWILSRNLIKKCCTWYNSMYPFMKKLKMVGVNWIPENYYLPSNLMEWLSLPWINDEIQCGLTTEKLSTNSMFSLIKTEDETPQTDDELIIDTKNNENIKVSLTKNQPKIIPVNTYDIGVPISRESFDSNLKVKKKKSKKSNKIDIKNITTIDDMKLLLTYDSYPGLDKLQWNIIKKTISKKLLKLSKFEDVKKQEIHLKKIIHTIQVSIN